ILGAGFDCRPYRIAGLQSAKVFEVDHPATQAVKQRRLAEVGKFGTGHVTFAPIDFQEEALSDVLERAGFSRDERTFWIWEGVIEYLQPEAVDSTLRNVAQLSCAGSQIAFTYKILLIRPAQLVTGSGRPVS
ncbi:MAG: SAM-dependent methyltransferase, partial [bacterium]|nr:SAM-dependent methyltransferase [bacterium]